MREDPVNLAFVLRSLASTPHRREQTDAVDAGWDALDSPIIGEMDSESLDLFVCNCTLFWLIFLDKS